MAARRLLGATGYGLYSAPNQARADDVLVRERGETALSAAGDSVGRLRGRYQEEVVPPSTAADPFPPADLMRQVRALQGLQQSLSSLGSTIRAQPAPAQDAIWVRLRSETATLQQLLECDLGLVVGAEALRDQLRAVTRRVERSGGGRGGTGSGPAPRYPARSGAASPGLSVHS